MNRVSSLPLSKPLLLALVLGAVIPSLARAANPPSLINGDSIHTLVDQFAAQDKTQFKTTISNDDAWAWMQANVPFFECPQPQIQEIYAFRWWSYRKHIAQTPDGHVITEFLPQVPWGGKDNTISCAAGHHVYEGRWLRDQSIIKDYLRFWFQPGAQPRKYSFWAADATWAFYLATGDDSFPKEMFDKLAGNYGGWQHEHFAKDIGLYWQTDNADGMECSIGGNGFRPTINSYMYGEASALTRIANLAGRSDDAQRFDDDAGKIKQAVQTQLWNSQDSFFETANGKPGQLSLANVREQIGFVPWYFNLPDDGKGFEDAWKQLLDPQGFSAPFGPTTAEQRNPRFMQTVAHDCLWNGPSWPYATSQTLTAMANLLNNYSQTVVTPQDYVSQLTIYAQSQYRDGQPWVAEDLDALTGKWIVDKPRSVYYNHSTFCDLVITGLVGLRPSPDNVVEVNPLAPSDWDYFCLENVPYHGHLLTIFYDRTGQRYNRGKGLFLLADGKPIASSPSLGKLSGQL
jgi:hypothetical protein